MRPVTPRGFRDVLPAEAAEREALERVLGETLESWGYGRIETPVVERLDALEAAAGSLEGTAFRLVDLDGRLLALRPDMTVPIARLVASRLGLAAGAHRLRYAADVFREHESLRGQSRQFRQVGVELVGAHGAAGDAEVIAVMVDALTAAGLSKFTVAVGTVEVLASIVAAAQMGPEWGERVFAAAHDRNLVELDRLAGASGVSECAARALRAVPRIRGGRQAIERARVASAACGCDDALSRLDATLELLAASGIEEQVVVDFSVMRSFDYYTGVVFEAYAPGVGLALGAGGRYDGMLAAFDAPQPAAGFALGLERLTIALVEQQRQPRVRRLDAVVGGVTEALAFSAASTLRKAGWRVALSQSAGRELVAEADAREAVEALWAREDGSIVRLDRAGEPASPVETPVPYAPTTSWAEGGERS